MCRRQIIEFDGNFIEIYITPLRLRTTKGFFLRPYEPLPMPGREPSTAQQLLPSVFGGPQDSYYRNSRAS